MLLASRLFRCRGEEASGQLRSEGGPARPLSGIEWCQGDSGDLLFPGSLRKK
jgi:hypothetical protein